MSKGMVFDVQRFSVSDGPGIRTTVFFKGCPLRCAWCHNPESFTLERQLRFIAQFCRDCGACAAACPSHIAKGASDCDVCGTCAEACPYDALRVCGRSVYVGQLMEELIRDVAFYQRSGGGVTLSGGEPTFQAKFVRKLLLALKERGIHTALDTCGACETDTFLDLCGLADLILFDLKIMDNGHHRRLTGVSNARILENLSLLAEQKKDLRVRMPLIPGVNDDEQSLAALARFLLGLGIRLVDIIPYHTYGIGKYAQLRMAEPQSFPTPDDKMIAQKLQILNNFGLSAHVI